MAVRQLNVSDSDAADVKPTRVACMRVRCCTRANPRPISLCAADNCHLPSLASVTCRLNQACGNISCVATADACMAMSVWVYYTIVNTFTQIVLQNLTSFSFSHFFHKSKISRQRQGRPVNVKRGTRCAIGQVGGKQKNPKMWEF